MTTLNTILEPIQLSKVRVKKAAEIVAGQIRNAIVRGELQVGATLPNEAELIKTFEVSRPTIREAIRILESEDLLQVSRGARGGAKIQATNNDLVVRTLGLTLQTRGTTLGDVYRARMAIEPAAARMAAQVQPKLAVRNLLEHVDHERSQIANRPAQARTITSFHRLLVEQSSNQTLILISHALNEITEKHLALVHRSHTSDNPEDQDKRRLLAFKSHEKLARLIGEGKGDEAETHWRTHMTKVADFWLRGLETSGLDILE